MKLARCVALACLALFVSSAHAEEQESLKPVVDGTLALTAKQVAAGVGFAWGGGKLTFREKTYEVVVDGLTLGAVGVSLVEAKGEVFYLRRLGDIEGRYTAVVGGATPGVGGAALVMRNEHGVEIRMVASTRGVSLTAGTSGVTLALKK